MKSRSEEGNGEQSTSQATFIKQGWSQLKTLHCKLLPEKIVNHGSKSYKRIQIEMLAHRWQHHCLEVINYILYFGQNTLNTYKIYCFCKIQIL